MDCLLSPLVLVGGPFTTSIGVKAGRPDFSLGCIQMRKLQSSQSICKKGARLALPTSRLVGASLLLPTVEISSAVCEWQWASTRECEARKSLCLAGAGGPERTVRLAWLGMSPLASL